MGTKSRSLLPKSERRSGNDSSEFHAFTCHIRNESILRELRKAGRCSISDVRIQRPCCGFHPSARRRARHPTGLSRMPRLPGPPFNHHALKLVESTSPRRSVRNVPGGRTNAAPQIAPVQQIKVGRAGLEKLIRHDPVLHVDSAASATSVTRCRPLPDPLPPACRSITLPGRRESLTPSHSARNELRDRRDIFGNARHFGCHQVLHRALVRKCKHRFATLLRAG
jgi:hypothetical protein